MIYNISYFLTCLIAYVLDMFIQRRLPVRKLDVRRRHHEITVKMAYQRRKVMKNLRRLLLLRLLDDDSNDEIWTILILLVYRKYRRLTYCQVEDRPLVQRVRKRKIIDFLDVDCYSLFRFHKEDLPRLMVALDVPRFISLQDRRIVDGETAMLVTLYRLAKPTVLGCC
jgi:hypothetical protein